eukprot:c19536_g1_i1.p1 GENE.c19536_g1_i1~~c19536_g1_i1.p1  ORF type:complete len:307 (-),score=100.24 c19536_g1_i1:19-939(-)
MSQAEEFAFPDDLVPVIASKIQYFQDFVSFKSTCRQFHNILTNPEQEKNWARFFLNEFGVNNLSMVRRMLSYVFGHDNSLRNHPHPEINSEKFISIFEWRTRFRNAVEVVEGDITNLPFIVDAIVVPAQENLRNPRYGVMNAVYQAAGPKLTTFIQSRFSGSHPVSTVITTSSFEMEPKVKFIIHAVGPSWSSFLPPAIGENGQYDLTDIQEQKILQLAHTYKNCFEAAENHGVTKIAFSGISTGNRAFPVPFAAAIAFRVAQLHLQNPSTTIKKIYFVGFPDHSSVLPGFRKGLKEVFDDFAPDL